MKNVSEIEKRKIGMYDETPKVIIGDWSICEMIVPVGNSVWIENIESNEGGEFKKETLSKILGEFFNKEF